MFAPRSAWLCRVISLFLFACVPVFSQSSQSVSGCVQDPSHAAIRTASVTLTSSDTFTRFQRHTDEKGCFTFDDVHPGKYQLRVLAESFSPYEKDITAENTIEPENIVLEIRPVQATAVVTATRSLASTTDVAASVDVIDRLQIEASHIEAASDLLRNVGGIQVVRTGNPGGITSLFTRGGASTYTKILLDGIPLNQPAAPTISHISQPTTLGESRSCADPRALSLAPMRLPASFKWLRGPVPAHLRAIIQLKPETTRP